MSSRCSCLQNGVAAGTVTRPGDSPALPRCPRIAQDRSVVMPAVSPPEQGQLVDVRQRRWVVTDVAASLLPPSPLKPARPPEHLVSLASVEDDALGEELQVIWQMEPGTRVHEKLA